MTLGGFRSATLLTVIIFIAAACSPGNSTGTTGIETPGGTSENVSVLDADLVERGSDLYQQNCAACHGADLSGEDNWKSPNPDGSYPAPPHDSSGHTWHHSDTVLLSIIRDGIDLPISRMPSFGAQLGDDEILAIIEFLKSNWGTDERTFQWQVTQQDRGASG